VVVPTPVCAASEDFGATTDGALAKRIDRAAGELAALVTTGLGGPEAPDPGPQAPRRRTVEDEFASVTPFEQLLREAGGDSVR
jgi:FMN reductase